MMVCSASMATSSVVVVLMSEPLAYLVLYVPSLILLSYYMSKEYQPKVVISNPVSLKLLKIQMIYCAALLFITCFYTLSVSHSVSWIFAFVTITNFFLSTRAKHVGSLKVDISPSDLFIHLGVRYYLRNIVLGYPGTYEFVGIL